MHAGKDESGIARAGRAKPNGQDDQKKHACQNTEEDIGGFETHGVIPGLEPGVIDRDDN
jgi:hypothetical protein